MAFELTSLQLDISNQLAQLIRQNRSVLLEAVTGAGKTELVYQTIADELQRGHKVGFAIARRQVVLEIAKRLSQVFTRLDVIAVCHGYTELTTADLIVCTTHQLFRYYRYFDLLIIDEPDAFPYKGNKTLQGFASSACKGNYIYLTATPDRQLVDLVTSNQLVHLYLPKRPTGKNLCVPKVWYCYSFFVILVCAIVLNKLLKLANPIMIFVPTIKLSVSLTKLISIFAKTCCINSQVENKDSIIEDFRNNKYQVCVSTTVLERGITIDKLNVIVLFADNKQFDKASLIQMSGRVGRNKLYPTGFCYFISCSRQDSIDECLKDIQRANDA